MTIQDLIVCLAVTWCVLYCLRSLWRSLRGTGGDCGCGTPCAKGKKNEPPLVQISLTDRHESRGH